MSEELLVTLDVMATAELRLIVARMLGHGCTRREIRQALRVAHHRVDVQLSKELRRAERDARGQVEPPSESVSMPDLIVEEDEEGELRLVDR